MGCTFFLFFIGIIGALMGCGHSVLLEYWVFKFIFPILLYLISLFIYNAFFDWLNGLSVLCGSCFLILQMMLLYDLGHVWNEIWIDNALEVQRRDITATGQGLFIAIIVAGSVFLTTALTGSIIIE